MPLDAQVIDAHLDDVPRLQVAGWLDNRPTSKNLRRPREWEASVTGELLGGS